MPKAFKIFLVVMTICFSVTVIVGTVFILAPALTVPVAILIGIFVSVFFALLVVITYFVSKMIFRADDEVNDKSAQ